MMEGILVIELLFNILVAVLVVAVVVFNAVDLCSDF